MKRHIKHRHMPGDISKAAKISLLETGAAFPGDVPEPARRTAYKKIVLMKERAVLKERTRKLIDAWNESFSE